MASLNYNKKLFVSEEDWKGLNDIERQFILDAHSNYFSYELLNGGVVAYGIPNRSNLFSVATSSKNFVDKTMYWPII